jgi:hypothetical protein
MRATLRLELKAPDANGFPTRDESRRLVGVEEELDALLAREIDAWFVARFTWKGSRTLVY